MPSFHVNSGAAWEFSASETTLARENGSELGRCPACCAAGAASAIEDLRNLIFIWAPRTKMCEAENVPNRTRACWDMNTDLRDHLELLPQLLLRVICDEDTCKNRACEHKSTVKHRQRHGPTKTKGILTAVESTKNSLDDCIIAWKIFFRYSAR